MKKNSLLALSVLLSMATASAQQTNLKTETLRPAKLSASHLKRTADVQRKAPARSPENGVYYARPTGTFYQGSALDMMWATYYQPMLYVPAFKELTFTNMCTTPDQAIWSINGQEIDPVEFPGNFTPNNDFIISYSQAAGYYSYPPTVNVGATQYTLGETAKYFDTYGSGVVAMDTIANISPFDMSSGTLYTGVTGSVYAYGTETFAFDPDGEGEQPSVMLTTYGIFHVFDKPASPLWFDRMRFLALTTSEKPFAGDKTLTVEIRDVVTNEAGGMEPGEEIYATLDVCQTVMGDKLQNGKTTCELIFSRQTTDILGSVTNVPVVIDKPFSVLVKGFNEEGVDVGFGLAELNPTDTEDTRYTYTLTLDPEGNPGTTVSYGPGVAAPMEFIGIMDVVEVIGRDSLNVLRISEDGTTCSNEGSTVDTNMGGAVVYTACPWYNNSGAAQYKLENQPEWVRSVSSVSDYRNEQGYVGMEIMSVVCDPLPEGVEGRFAEVYVSGRGVKSEYPVILLQGDVDVTATGIGNIVSNEASASAQVYNLKGLKVNKDTKGLVIKNGKKVVNK